MQKPEFVLKNEKYDIHGDFKILKDHLNLEDQVLINNKKKTVSVDHRVKI